MVAVNDVLFTKVVARSAPAHRNTDRAENPHPVTVSVNPVEPTILVLGERLVITGTGSEARPVPARFTVCGLPEPSLVIVRAPVRGPVAVGEKPTLIEQSPPAAIVPQLLVCKKSP